MVICGFLYSVRQFESVVASITTVSVSRLQLKLAVMEFQQWATMVALRAISSHHRREL